MNKSRNDGAGGNTPTYPAVNGGAVLCVDGAEARILRRSGYTCITSAKMRRLLGSALCSATPEAAQAALCAVKRLEYITSADDPNIWPMWRKFFAGHPFASEVRAALSSIASLPTPLRDPLNVVETAEGCFWPCSGTTVMVGKNTFELVRVADTYAGFDCYRPHGRMDEPFIPQPNRVCLVTEDELRLLRLEGMKNISVVLTYRVEETSGRVETRWPSPVRALCGENPALTIGLAPWLVVGRHGYPFFLGLTRGIGYETTTETATDGAAAMAFCFETNTAPEPVRVKVVTWAGGDDIRQLVRYGGLSIFTGADTRRKVQLRSLGLAKSGTVAGAAIYDLGANYARLTQWAISRTFTKPSASQRERNRRRVRSRQASVEYARGTYIIQEPSPRRINLTVSNAREAARSLRKMAVGEVAGVSTVRLESLVDGGVYCLNGRAKMEDGEIVIDQKRCKIRCPRWEPKDSDAMLQWLAQETHVILAGKEQDGRVFAVVRVANGTEDQQAEASARWSEAAGRRFADPSGACSWHSGSLRYDSFTRIGAIIHTNWRAQALETACFERYQTTGDYGKPLKLAPQGTASASERARMYAEKAEGLSEQGYRNTRLASALLNMRDTFGTAATSDALPYLLAKSSLPTRMKKQMVKRILNSGDEAR